MYIFVCIAMIYSHALLLKFSLEKNSCCRAFKSSLRKRFKGMKSHLEARFIIASGLFAARPLAKPQYDNGCVNGEKSVKMLNYDNYGHGIGMK